MKRLFLLLALLLLSLNLCATDVTPLKPQQHKAMHWVIFQDEDQRLSGCTANAISEHVLITAEHCNGDQAHAGNIWIDHNYREVENGVAGYAVTEKYFDERDHMLLVVPTVSFKDTIPYDFRPVLPGERVYFWGNPFNFRDVYREGMMLTTVAPLLLAEPKEGANIQLFWMRIGSGDSGGTVFGEDGRAVSIVTFGIFGGKYMGAYPVQFSQAQLDAAAGKRGTSCSVVLYPTPDEDDQGNDIVTNVPRFECRP